MVDCTKPDKISRKCKINDLSATVGEHAVDANVSRFNPIDVRYVITFAENVFFAFDNSCPSCNDIFLNCGVRPRHQLCCRCGWRAKSRHVRFSRLPIQGDLECIHKRNEAYRDDES